MGWWPGRAAGAAGVMVFGAGVLAICLLHTGAPPSRIASAAPRQEGTAPVAVIADVGDLPLGSPVTFDAAGSQGIQLSFSWDFGDGTPPATGVTVQHFFTSVDDYTVGLTVHDAQGNADSATRKV